MMELEINMGQDKGRVITIDGPAASGKTSVSRELARRLGWNWVSTGSFYRGLGYAANRLRYNLNDEEKLAQLFKSNKWHIEMTESKTRVFFEGQDVTDEIATEEVGTIASQISKFPKVRASLLDGQRECRNQAEGLVAEGRDCGTVVFPDADVKIYLTARSEDRAARRAKELGVSEQETIEAQKNRDKEDSTRKAAPLTIPEDALVVDSSRLTFDEVLNCVENFVRKKIKR